MAAIGIINSNMLEAICRVLANTGQGLTGSEIGHLLFQMRIDDFDHLNTKWKRLYNALAKKQKADGHGASIYQFIETAMDPVRFTGNSRKFEELRDALNQVIAFLGYSLNEGGKLKTGDTVTTLPEAKNRAHRLRVELERRGVHPDVLKVCQARFLQHDYFYAILEAAKSIAEKIREKSGLESDGALLVDESFVFPKEGYPLLAFNDLKTNSKKSEHKGLANLIKGLFGAFRNPTAHEPEHTWPISEQDCLDILTISSLIHRRLDNAAKTKR